MKLAVIDTDAQGQIIIKKVLGEGDVKYWEQNFAIAKEAIEYQAKHSKLEEFNNLHLNLLLTKLIKQGVINKRGVNLDPLLRKMVEVETARSAWVFSRKKKLMNEFEYKYQVFKGTFERALWKRVISEGVEFSINFIARFIPQPIKNIWKNLNEFINARIQ